MFYQLEHIGTVDHFKKEQGENFAYPPHLHQSFELIFLDEGEMTVSVNGLAYELKKGDAVLIFPNQVHSISSTCSKHTLFIFSPHVIQSFFSENTGKLPKSNRFTLSETSETLLKNLSANSSKYEIKGVLYTVCASFDRQADYENAVASDKNVLSKILGYIERNFKNACSVTDIAKNTSYNPEYVSRIFKKGIGVSCNGYVTARRLSYATYLLTKTEQSCLACALESGFTSLRSFNRNFKKHLGVSPMEYRATARKWKARE